MKPRAALLGLVGAAVAVGALLLTTAERNDGVDAASSAHATAASSTGSARAGAAAEPPGPDAPAPPRPTEAQVRRFINGTLDNPRRGCARTTEAFLKNNYGAAGVTGVERCEAGAEEARDVTVEIEKVQVLTATGAEVLVSDDRHNRVIVTLAWVDGRFLLDDLQEPG
jgi:hypothetical protein